VSTDGATFTAMSSEALAAGGYVEEAGSSVPVTRMRPVKAPDKSASGTVTSFAAAIRTRRGDHAEVSIRAGQSKSHRALCGMVVMRISEAEDFVAMCNAWNDAHFDKDSS